MWNIFINAATSGCGRRQLSEENAYTVSTPMPRSGAASTARRKASAPARCPATRGSPRAEAQRPLPSMMMAACSRPEVLCGIPELFDIKNGSKKRGLTFPNGLDQRFHVIQIFLQSAPAGLGQTVLGLGHAAFKGFRADNILGL